MSSTKELIVEKVLPPILSGAFGVLTALWRASKSLVDRVSAVEHEIAGVKQSLTSLQQVVSKQYESIVESISDRAKARDLVEYKKQIVKLSEQVMKLQERLAALNEQTKNNEESINAVNDGMANFVREQNDQWQSMNRSLGRIEGSLREGTPRRASGSFNTPRKDD